MDVALESDVVIHAALEHSPRGAAAGSASCWIGCCPRSSDTGSAKTFIYTSGNC